MCMWTWVPAEAREVSGLELEAAVSHLTWTLGPELVGEQVLWRERGLALQLGNRMLFKHVQDPCETAESMSGFLKWVILKDEYVKFVLEGNMAGN